LWRFFHEGDRWCGIAATTKQAMAMSERHTARFRHVVRCFRGITIPVTKMETTDKKTSSAPRRVHGAIPMPEHLDRTKKPEMVRRSQSTVGTKTPGKGKKKDMSEAAERKARRDEKPEKE